MTKVCPHCWQRIRIRKDGTFARHPKSECEGSFCVWLHEPKLLTWPYPPTYRTVRWNIEWCVISEAHYFREGFLVDYFYISGEILGYVLGTGFIPASKLSLSPIK